MARTNSERRHGRCVRGRRRAVAVGLVGAFLAGAAQAAPPPPPPRYSSPRPPADDPPPRVVPGPPPGAILVAPARPPAPLPVALRIAYAPFYAAGLVLHYGFYYVVVAPLEVFGRTLTYGVEGGVSSPPHAP